MVQQLETAPAEASEPAFEAESQAEVPASPAALWASESRANYSITHTDQTDHAWVDCGCVIHSD